MKLLDLKDNQVIVDPHILATHEFKVIWDRDETQTKEMAFAEFAFLYHFCDINSPYTNYPDDKRLECVIKDIIRQKDWKPDKEIKAAIKKYLELSESTEQRVLKAAKAQLEEIAKYFKTTKFNEETRDAIISLFKNIVPVLTNYKKFEEMVVKEQEKSGGHIRGNRTVSMFEE